MSQITEAKANYSSSSNPSSKSGSPLQKPKQSAKPTVQEMLIRNMPFQEIEKQLSERSNASAPDLRTVEIRGAQPGFIRNNGEDINMLVTQGNVKDCYKEIKKQLRAFGAVPLTSVFRPTDLDSDLQPPEGTDLHHIVRDVRVTLGPDADLMDLKRCEMIEIIYSAPKFDNPGGSHHRSRMDLNLGSSNTFASDVIDHTGRLYLSMFHHEIYQEDSLWEPPAFHPYCGQIPGLEHICSVVRKKLYHSRYLVFKTFMTRDPITNVIVCENLVQLTYWDRVTRKVTKSLPQQYDDFCRKLLLADGLYKIR